MDDQTAGIRLNKKTIISFISLVVLLVAIPVGVYLSQKTQIFKSRAYDSSEKFQVVLGEEEYVMGPVGDWADMFFLAEKTSEGIKAFSANGNTYLFQGGDLNHLTNQGKVLTKGDNTVDIDGCGAWLSSIYQLDKDHWLGWYHSEDHCQYSNNGETHMTMAFTESFDGGLTWKKTSSSDSQVGNKVITASSEYANDINKNNTGTGRVIKVGDYFYMFFMTTADWKTHIARSKVSDEGRPGTWMKYYNGSFSEKGIGGKSTALLDGFHSFITFNSYLNRFIIPTTFARWGFSLRFSKNNDILTWDNPQPVYPLVSDTADDRADNWWASPRTGLKEIYSYPSFVSSDGSSEEIGKEFYLYYMKVYSGEGLDTRYILRRRATLYKNQSDPYSARVVLSRYEKSGPRKTKISTEIAKPAEGYSKKSDLGYLLPYETSGFTSLYDCYIPSWGEYFLSIADPSQKKWEHCEGDGDTFVRRIGYVSQSQTAEADTPLYRCFDESGQDHFAATEVSCEGKKNEGILGYIFSKATPSGQAVTSTPIPTSSPTPVSTTSVFVSVTPTPTQSGSNSRITPTRTPIPTAESTPTPSLFSYSGNSGSNPVPTSQPTPVESNPTPSKTPLKLSTQSSGNGSSNSNDLNYDGVVNTFDVSLVIKNIGKTSPGSLADLNGDGTVNSLDYSLMLKSLAQSRR